MAMTLLAAASGEAADYVIKDEQKLMAVAGTSAWRPPDAS